MFAAGPLRPNSLYVNAASPVRERSTRRPLPNADAGCNASPADPQTDTVTAMSSELRDDAAATPGLLARAFSAIRDRRVPYRVQVVIDQVLPRFGIRFRRIRVGDLNVDIRRNTWDERAARRVIGAREYTPLGSEIKAGDVVIDIGANIGAFAITAGSTAPGVRVFAFEPDADNWALAARNAAINGLTNVHVLRKAVSGEPGTLKLYKGAQGSLHTTVAGRLADPAGYEEVESVTLSQIMDEHSIGRCAFLKLDCEGAEYDILYRTPPACLARIDQMAVKYHAHVDKARKSQELFRFLERAGFEILEIDDHADGDDGLVRARRRLG